NGAQASAGMSGPSSTKRTSRPASANMQAVTEPPGPEPTTATSARQFRAACRVNRILAYLLSGDRRPSARRPVAAQVNRSPTTAAAWFDSAAYPASSETSDCAAVRLEYQAKTTRLS